ncbi:hypothetical protein Sa4125_29820 [Aureimonas sp. SA4125]|uniref:hypothetical protein n=1 Tax=Aureimonas sp. SA4125 TaxID=2826993 RepID=UPI001CC58A07|nr:hypothetical protein [Aureimonas sp. SA4125]BDA85440.1 hypothetical protein Sa4125_29820 [Aureimonas sp. SA4125]
MKRLVLNPAGWTCPLGECPPGPLVHDGELFFKDDYGQHFLDNGDSWATARGDIVVQPVVAEWEDWEL